MLHFCLSDSLDNLIRAWRDPVGGILKQVFYLAVLASVLGAPCLSQERVAKPRTWLRRLTLAGACAASFLDVRSTQSAVASGAAENNFLFADHAGKPKIERMIGFKLGACAGMGFAQEFRLFGKKNTEAGWIAANTAMAGTFSAIAIHNKAVASNTK